MAHEPESEAQNILFEVVSLKFRNCLYAETKNKDLKSKTQNAELKHQN